jgi:hypothetical protein
MKKSINVFSKIIFFFIFRMIILLILNPITQSIYQINKIILSHQAFYLDRF